MSVHGDLGLGLRHEDERPPRKRRPRATGMGRAAVIAVVLVGLLAVVGAGVFGVRAVSRRLIPGDYKGAGTGAVTVQVRTGETASDIAATLSEAKVVKTAGAFRRAAVDDKRSGGIQPGYYRLRSGMSASVALTLLLSPSARINSRVVIPEGATLPVALQTLASEAHISLPALQQAAASPAGLGLPAQCRGRLEGCLFPATYSIAPGTTATAALREMLDRFAQAGDSVGLAAGATALHLTPYQVITVASLLEKEARLPADFPKVARVVYNRLAIGQHLQLDSTVVYITKNRTGKVSKAETLAPSAYNTYLHPGLPPTPIDSPGEAALRAALHPAAGNWLYFVAIDKSGRTMFSHDYADFTKWKLVGKRNGVV